jgi:hypothetical protein
MKGRRSSLAAAFLGGMAWFHLILGPALAHFGWVAPIFGFLWLFCFGLFEGLAALVIGAVSLYRSAPTSPFRNAARFGFGCGLAACVLGFGLGALQPIPTATRSGEAEFARPADDLYDAALGAIEQRDWAILDEDRPTRTFSARARSRVFRFVDDLEIRIEAGLSADTSRFSYTIRSEHNRGPVSSNGETLTALLESLR